MYEIGPFGYRVWISQSRDRNMSDQKSFSYKGERIVQNDYPGLHQKVETMGFTVNHAYVVVDELECPTLPIVQQWFWSPWEAKKAIDFVHWLKPTLPRKNWPTTIQYEYTQMINYQRNFHHVYEALHDIKKLCVASKEWGDNPADAIIDRLQLLHQLTVENKPL